MPSANFKENREQLIQTFYERLTSGERFKTITQARSLAASVLREPVRPGQPIAKAVEEAIEQAVILVSQNIIEQEIASSETFDRLVDLYQRQPTLGTRTSTSVEMQAYSTPIPLSYLAGKIAGIDKDKTIYEPTAGRGALLLLSSPDKVFANELNPDRVADLRKLGYRATQHDATRYRPSTEVDVVIANPPFGRRKRDNKLEHFQIGGSDTSTETSEIDQAIAWRSLEAMKDSGRAVLIIGSERGTDEQRLQKYNTVRVRKFFYNLYRHYHVAQHITIDGRLYSKQGAAFPVDLIAIKGRKLTPYLAPKKERMLPSVDLPTIYTSYQDLKDLLPQEQDNEYNADSTIYSDSSGVGLNGKHQPAISSNNATNPGDQESRALSDSDGTPPAISSRNVQQANSDAELGEPDTGKMRDASQYRYLHSEPRERGSPESNRRESASSREDKRSSSFSSASRNRSSSEGESRRSSDEPDTGRMADRANNIVNLPLFSFMATSEQNPKEQNGQVPYKPRSKAKGLDSYVPLNLERPIQTALENLEREVGNIDQFVTDALDFGGVEKLHRALAAEQVDGVALGIRALQEGKAALIGDDTGLGKGRQMAAAIKYAIATGNIPIFITKDPGLYSDMVRDLTDIGLDSSQIRPFMTNSSETIPLPDGRTLQSSPTSHQRELNQMRAREDLLPQYNMIFSTYSQLQTVKGADTDRRFFLYEMAARSILVLDEAHEGGGSEQASSSKHALNRAEFVRVLTKQARGVFFASATAVKRPDVADLYARRMNIAESMSMTGFQKTLELGGTPLQQVASSMMAQDGQYIRRARTYDGVEVGSQVVETEHSDADQLGEIMRAVLKFDKEKANAVSELNKEVRKYAKGVTGDGSIGLAGAKSTNFSSIMWNVVDQAALARKADAVADYALSVLKADEKPFIGLSNTMGSFIDQYVKVENIRPGDSIDVSFQDVLARYLERSRDVTVRDHEGTMESRRPLTDNELGIAALEQYEKAEELINQANFSSMPVSPIDWIRHRIESAGYTFGELTGRTARLEYDANGRATYQARGTADTSKAAKIEIIAGFNSGSIDVGLGNRSASTGFSMHSSSKFSDQRRRHFIIAQPERDINIFKQFMGRFHRTGQVNAPKISLISGDTPDEKRPAAVLAKKLASLNANTTAARQGGIDFDDIPDYLNEVGDQVVSDMMRFDPDLSEQLYDPIFVTEDSTRPVEGAVAKVTGCLPILPVVEQEAFYKQLDEEYRATLDRYAALGENPLEASNVDLDARTLASVELLAKQEGKQSVFAEGITAEIADVKVQSKPKPQLEVINDVRKTLGIPIVHSVEQHSKEETDAHAREFVEQLYTQATSAVEQYRTHKKNEYLEQEPDHKKRLGKSDKLDIRTGKQLEILTQIRRFRPGQTVRVTASNDRVYYGAITAVKKRGKQLSTLVKPGSVIKENPAIPSKWEIEIALADSKRQISIPLSKLNTAAGGKGTYAVSIAAFSLEEGDIYESFDKKQGDDRELRVLLKGNLLRLGDTPYQSKGDLIVATMSHGQPEPIMLMEPGFDINQEMSTSPVVLPGATAVHQFMQITRNTGVVKTLDESITFKHKKTGEYLLHTGRSRKDIFQDAGLREAAGDIEFVSIADRMEAEVPAHRLEALMNYLKEEHGRPIAAFSDHQAARDLLGIQMPEIRLTDTAETAMEREGLPPSVDMSNLESIRQKLNADHAAASVEPERQEDAEDTAIDRAEEEQTNDDIGQDISESLSLSDANLNETRAKLDSLLDREDEPGSGQQEADSSVLEDADRNEPVQPLQDEADSEPLEGAEQDIERDSSTPSGASQVPDTEATEEPGSPEPESSADTTEPNLSSSQKQNDREADYKTEAETEDTTGNLQGEVESAELADLPLFASDRTASPEESNAISQERLDELQDDETSGSHSLSDEELPQQTPSSSGNKQSEDEEISSPNSTETDKVSDKPVAPTKSPSEPNRAPSENPYVVVTDSPGIKPVEIPQSPVETPSESEGDEAGTESAAYLVINEPPSLRSESIPEQPGSQSSLSQVPESNDKSNSYTADDIAYVDDLIAEHDGDVDAIINEILDSKLQLPSQSLNKVVPDEQETGSRVETSYAVDESLSPPLMQVKASTSMPEADFVRAMQAAAFIEDPMMLIELEKLEQAQPGAKNISISPSLKKEAEETIRLARLKFQNQLASEIVPLAKQLITIADDAGLTKYTRDDTGRDIKLFQGKNYAVRYRGNISKEEVEVYCRKAEGYIYATDGEIKEAVGLKQKDRDRFAVFVERLPKELKKALHGQSQNARAKNKSAGIGV